MTTLEVEVAGGHSSYRGTRTRVGNAMGTTRMRLLAAAGKLVAEQGTKVTMVDIATEAGIAKATLYNHFRTKEEILSALITTEIIRAYQIGAALNYSLSAALTAIARFLSDHPMLTYLRNHEPAVLVALVVQPAEWPQVVELVKELLSETHGDLMGAELVTRWIASYITVPCEASHVEHMAGLIAAQLTH